MIDAAFLANAMDMLPDPLTVTVLFRNRATAASASVDGSRRRPVSSADITWASMAGLGIPTAQFLIPVNQLGGNVLKQGDEIDEAAPGTLTWNVLRADLEMQGTIYRAYVSEL